jgi:hypothetical protein
MTLSSNSDRDGFLSPSSKDSPPAEHQSLNDDFFDDLLAVTPSVARNTVIIAENAVWVKDFDVFSYFFGVCA